MMTMLGLLCSILLVAASTTASTTVINSPESYSEHGSDVSISVSIMDGPKRGTVGKADYGISTDEIYLCFSLVNKRISWEQVTHCTKRDDPISFTVETKKWEMEFPNGVYRLRSYLSTSDAQGKHSRGGHGVTEGYVQGSEHIVWFIVEKGKTQHGLKKIKRGDSEVSSLHILTRLNSLQKTG
jgi:hypothetical protein